MFWKKIKEQVHTHKWERVGYFSGKMRPYPGNPHAQHGYLYNCYYCQGCWEYSVGFGWNEIKGKLPQDLLKGYDQYFEKDAVYRYIKKTLEEVRDDFLTEDYSYNYSI